MRSIELSYNNIGKMVQNNHNHNSIQCNMMAFYCFDPTFRPMGGPSSGNILEQDWYNKVQDCVSFSTCLFIFVAMVTDS